MTIVDAHHHLWDPSVRAYPWMTELVAPIARPFGASDLEATLPPNVTHTVAVQATATLEESETLLHVAANTPRIAGVIAWIDLAGDAAEQIAHLRSKPGGEKLVGIRHQVHDEEDANWLLREDVQRGLAAVGEAGLAYDFLVRPRETAAAARTAQRFPHTRFVLDHGAKPAIAHGTVEPWRAGVARLAVLPNVACKLSGLVTEAPWDSWTQEQIVPYGKMLLDLFGAQRLLFGSDWPVCLLAASYDRVLALAERICERLLPAEMEAVFRRNAVRVYQLEIR
jgi:L-fuconolactonase